MFLKTEIKDLCIVYFLTTAEIHLIQDGHFIRHFLLSVLNLVCISLSLCVTLLLLLPMSATHYVQLQPNGRAGRIISGRYLATGSTCAVCGSVSVEKQMETILMYV